MGGRLGFCRGLLLSDLYLGALLWDPGWPGHLVHIPDLRLCAPVVVYAAPLGQVSRRPGASVVVVAHPAVIPIQRRRALWLDHVAHR